jgi:cytochrome aa3-600 menaquinol oxidase subunit II
MGKSPLLNGFKLVAMAALTTVLLAGCSNKYIVLDPQGPVAETQKNLIYLSVILCAIVVIPVLILLAWIVYRYRDTPGNKAPYQPEWHDSKVLETIWWGIPIVIIGILASYTARDTYALAKPIVTDAKPVTIQVTSLDWKWLFQYPDQKIATVNYVEIPAGVPVQFVLTSDAPMNSFWIPQLGGQEYTMPGMAMRLMLQADKPGEYEGMGANFSGEGFAHMNFKVISKPQAEFENWVKDVQKNNNPLTKDGYTQLSKPGTADRMTFSSYPAGLFDDTVNKNGGKYMNHDNMNQDQMNHEIMNQDGTKHDMSNMNNMNMNDMNMNNMKMNH